MAGFYTQGGRKAYSASELQEAMKARATGAMDQGKMMQMIQEAQAKGQDPTQAIMAWQKSLAGLGSDPTRNFEGRQGIVSPRYIPADDMFSRVVVVFRDELVGATGIAVPLPPKAADAAMPTGDAVMQQVARMQFLQQPTNRFTAGGRLIRRRCLAGSSREKSPLPPTAEPQGTTFGVCAS